MKKGLLMLIALSLLVSVLPPAAAGGYDVTSEPWMSSDGTVADFHTDGTVSISYASGKTETVEWDMEGNVLKYYYEYELWGSRQKYAITYLISETDGHLQLIHDANDSILYPKSIMEDILEQAKGQKVNAVQVPLGNAITEEFLEIQTDHMMGTRKLKSATAKGGLSRSSQTDGSILLCLCGKIENTGMEEMQLGGMYVRFILDNGQSFNGGAYAEYDDTGLQKKLPVLCDGNIWFYAEIPLAELEKASGCTVRLSFDEGITMIPLYPEAAAYTYDIIVDGQQMALDEDEIARPVVFFEDFPTLPTPESFMDVYVSSSSRSSSGKSKRGTYKFKAQDNEKSGGDILDAYIKALEAYPAFSIEKKGSSWTITEGRKTLMTVYAENDTLVFEYKN